MKPNCGLDDDSDDDNGGLGGGGGVELDSRETRDAEINSNGTHTQPVDCLSELIKKTFYLLSFFDRGHP